MIKKDEEEFDFDSELKEYLHMTSIYETIL